MAEEVQEQTGINVGAFFQTKDNFPQEKESGEAEELDTSEEEEVEDTEEPDEEGEESDSEDVEEDEDAEEEEPEKKPKKKKSKSLKDWKERAREAEKKLEAEEERRKGFQRETSHAVNRLAQVEQDMQDLLSQVNELKTGTAHSETDDLLESLGEGLVEADKVKKVIKGLVAKQNQKPASQEPAPNKQFTPWLTSLPDYQEVETWFADKKAEAEARMNMLPTKDSFARVQEVRLMHRDSTIKEQSEEIAKLKSRVKALQKRKSGKVPQTGPGGRNAMNPKKSQGDGGMLSKWFSA